MIYSESTISLAAWSAWSPAAWSCLRMLRFSRRSTASAPSAKRTWYRCPPSPGACRITPTPPSGQTSAPLPSRTATRLTTWVPGGRIRIGGDGGSVINQQLASGLAGLAMEREPPARGWGHRRGDHVAGHGQRLGHGAQVAARDPGDRLLHKRH